MNNEQKEHLLQESDFDSTSIESGSWNRRPDNQEVSISKRSWNSLLSILVLSLFTNVLFSGNYFLKSSTHHSQQTDISEFAGLTKDVDTTFEHMNKYTQENQTLADEEWEKIYIEPGVIALDQETITAHNLPAAQEFVWDTSKNVYVLNSYHSLHCLKLLRVALRDGFAQRPIDSGVYWHAVHCLDFLRQDVICNADDTPLYSLRGSKVGPGMGQPRKCKDFNKLEQWASERSACYTFEVFEKPGFHDHWKNCPKGSPYLESVYEYFGHAEDWMGDVWSP